MDDLRLKVNEDITDTLAARVDELERRLDTALRILRRDSVLKAMGLQDFDFHNTETNEMTLKLKPLSHTNGRYRALEALQQKEILNKLGRLSPSRLDQLLRER